jgi:Tfp pilus assembly protein PilN
MRAVNLLPREPRSKTPGVDKLPAIVGAGVGVVVVASLAGGFLLESAKVGRAQRGLNAAKVELAATPVPPPVPKVASEPAAVTAGRQPRLQAVATALGQRIAWDRILREFSLVLPNDVWLSSLTLHAPSPLAGGVVPSGPGTGLQLAGTTYSYDSVARFLARLSMIPDLAGVTLSNATDANHLVTFGVSASVKGAPAPPAPAPGATTTTTGASS